MGALITFPTISSMSCEGAGATAGRPGRRFQKHVWPRWAQKKALAFGLNLAFVAEQGVVKEHAPWRNPELMSREDATRSSVLKGVDAAISAWIAEEFNPVLGQELTGGEEKLPDDLVREAKEREFNARREFRLV